MMAKSEPKSAPMTYEVVRMPNVRQTLLDGAASGEAVAIPEPETQTVEVTAPRKGK